jgi:hypothetical protein
VITHSDAGSQYTSYDCAQVMDDHNVLASVGSVGDAYDNAMAESFVDTFKTELIKDRVWRSRTQLELAILEYVDGSTTAGCTSHSATSHPSSSNNSTPPAPGRLPATRRSPSSHRTSQNRLGRVAL